MNWNDRDSERIYNNYINNGSNVVLLNIGDVEDKLTHDYKTLLVCAPSKYVKNWMLSDQRPGKRYIQSALRNFINSNKRYIIPSDLLEITQHRYIDNMIVSNDLQHYINNPDYIVLDFNGIMKHQMELDL